MPPSLAAPERSHSFLLLPAAEVGHRSRDRLRLAPACPVPQPGSVSESPDRGRGPGAFGWERDTDRLPGSCSDQSGPDSEARFGTRSRGNCDEAVSQSAHSAEPISTLSGPAGQAKRNGTRETGSRRPASSLTRPSLASALKAPPVRRAVGTAAVRNGPRPSSPRSLDRGNGGPADSWSSQPARTPIIMPVAVPSGLHSRLSLDQPGPGMRASGLERHELD